MSPKVSIIVPVYKAEAYLHRCIDSLLNQTFQDYEILLIDDGSPDKSGEICDEYAKKDNRVRAFHKENGGVSSARQCGIDNALGEYIIHADPDDWVEPNMLEELYAKAKEEDADMVICDFYIEYIKSGKIEYINQKPSALDHDIVLKELFQQLHGSCWNKLVKRVCYNKYGVKFPIELSCNEDQYVIASLLINNIKVSYISKAFYHYTQDVNENSLIRKKHNYTERAKFKELFCNLMKGHKHYDICEKSIVFNFVTNIFFSGTLSSTEFKNKFYNYKDIIKENTKINIYMRYAIYLSCIGYYKPIYVFAKIKFSIKKIFV